jgi:Na+-transporting NADH:ubiquinone oxidoreductase subunit NqrE
VSVFDLVVDALVLGWILYRQRRVRRIRLRFARRVPIILSLAALVQFVHFTETHSLGAEVTFIAIGSCLIGGGVFGAIRAYTVTLVPMAKGVAQQASWLTIALWLVSLGIHFAMSGFVRSLHGPIDVTAASALLYMAISLGVQNTVVHRRAVRFLMRNYGAAVRAGTVDARSWEEPGD